MFAKFSHMRGVTQSHTRNWQQDWLHAEAERRYALAEVKAKGDMRRLGLKPGPIDVNLLDAALRSNNVSIHQRIAIKKELSELGWIA
jgi:hypothetical protein